MSDGKENAGASHKAIIPNSGYDGARSSIGDAGGVGDCAGAERRSLPGTCLQSLVGADWVSFEIIVVDDGSTDRTREIARVVSRRASDRVRDPYCRGWSGKNNALGRGRKSSAGRWLLFTDADTVHLPGSLAAQRGGSACSRRAALLSYSPEQEVQGFWEKAVMPVIFAELASTISPVGRERSGVSRGRRERAIHADFARSVRSSRRPCGGRPQACSKTWRWRGQ